MVCLRKVAGSVCQTLANSFRLRVQAHHVAVCWSHPTALPGRPTACDWSFRLGHWSFPHRKLIPQKLRRRVPLSCGFLEIDLHRPHRLWGLDAVGAFDLGVEWYLRTRPLG